MVAVIKRNIMEFLRDSEKVFIIPPFQRNYEWEETQCEELFEDIKLIAGEENKTHYLGNIVHYINKDTVADGTQYILIDGQQRITTILILLCALRNCDKENVVQNSIYEKYLINGIEGNDFKTKLKQTLYDQDAFSALVLNENSNTDNRVFKNYEYFKKLIEKEQSKISLKNLVDALKRIEIAEIDLEVKNDLETVQRIFEKINSTGKPLTMGDLIRNFLLLTKDIKEQKDLYKNYWLEIENRILSKNVSVFASDYLRMRLFKDIADKEVYKEFKKEFSKDSYSKEEVLKDMYKYSEYYSWLLEPNKILSARNKKNIKIKKLIEEIKSLRAKDYMSLLMFLLERMYNENIVELEKILKLLRDFLLRYRIVKVSRGGGGLTGVVIDLMKKISQKEIECTYEAIRKELSIKKSNSGRFPKDDEFKQELEKNVDNDCARLVLSIIEEVEYKNISVSIFEISIEHILPETLTSDWEKDLGGKMIATDIYEKYLNSIGNKALLSGGYNSSASNRRFFEKKDIYRKSQFKTTEDIVNFEKWNEEELIKRNKDISKRACECITSSLEINKNDENEVITSEDIKGRKIQTIKYNNRDYIIENWKDLCYKISEILYENTKDEFKTVSAFKKPLIVNASEKDNLKNAKQIKDSKFYCETDIKLSKDSFKYAKIIMKHFNQEDKFKIIVENEDDK